NYSEKLFSDGFVHVSNFFSSKELSDINYAIDTVHNNPTLFKILKKNEKGEFFMDYNNWRRNQNIENICKSPKIVDFMCSLTESKKCWLMHEDVIIKKGFAAETPIHHDRPYFIFKGDLNITMWTSVNDIKKESSLILLKGSHKIDNLFLPKNFSSSINARFENDPGSNFINIDEYDFSNYPEVSFDFKAGDAIFFFNRTVHRAAEQVSKSIRKSLAVRYLLDGASMTEIYYNDVPPYTRIGVKVKEDDPVPENFFPLLKS
ncbi:MAG: phytanoyl-CoA dioxygenase family protein, partial [Flavobacteriaceae bacterium]|nr:phytanoyl-CoA dioxygenase family protein [Flavobacteriaceae bacterium]